MFIESITAYGAVPGTLCTASLQAAINACHAAGGGEVIIEDGTYIIGTVFMQSGVTLRLRATGTLKASGNGEDYPEFDRDFDHDKAPRHTSRCLIYAGLCEDIGIVGEGKIDCSGAAFCEKVDDKARFYKRNTDILPARMVFLYRCRRVKLLDVRMEEMAGGWAYWINGCDEVTVRGLHILCDQHYPNSDGIHINCSADVTVSDCVIRCGDDSIILRANSNTLPEPRPLERVTITNCTLSSWCCAIRVAWANDGIIRDSTLSNLVITDSNVGIAMVCPPYPTTDIVRRTSDRGRDSTDIYHLHFDNIVMHGITNYPITFSLSKDDMVTGIRDVRFRGITAVAKHLPGFVAETGVVRDVHFTDCTFTATEPDAPMRFLGIDGVEFDGVKIRNQK